MIQGLYFTGIAKIIRNEGVTNLKRLAGAQEEQMKETIAQRIREMEAPGYRFPARFQKRDYLAVAVVAAVCLLLVVGGYYL